MDTEPTLVRWRWCRDHEAQTDDVGNGELEPEWVRTNEDHRAGLSKEISDASGPNTHKHLHEV